MLVRLAVGVMLTGVFGALGLGVLLIVEGLNQASSTFAALGVLLVVVALLSAGVGSWKLSGVGFEVSHQATSHVAERTRRDNADEIEAPNLELGPPSESALDWLSEEPADVEEEVLEPRDP